MSEPTFKSLKNGWLPLSVICEKYNVDPSNGAKMVKKLEEDDKEKINRVWFVKEKCFLQLFKWRNNK